jgi:tetratricopeptide (TPR) repeat protein
VAKHRLGHFGRTRHSAPSGSQRYAASSFSAGTAKTSSAELRLGLEAFEQGDYALATQAWKRARQSGTPSGLAAALAEAHFRRALGTANEARQIQELSEAVQLTPDRALYHFHLGLAYFRRNTNNAEFRLRLAILYRHLASTFEAAGNVHGAVRSLESALSFDVSQVDVQLRAAELYLHTENYGKAIDHLRSVLSAHPDDTRALATLGSARPAADA